MTPEARESSERLVLRIGAVSSVVGVGVLFVAEAFHGGHHPGNLSATLPVYAANRIWELVHIAQFVGYLLLLLGLLAVYRSMHDGRSGTIARIGFVTAVVATAIFGVNQAVDGVAVKFVADQWVSAPTPQKAETFRIANAVRHVEIGTTSFSQLTFGLALLLNGLALALARSYPQLLGWAGMVLGGVYVAAGVLVAHNGFTVVGFTATAGIGLAFWFLFLGFILWRKADSSTGDH